MKKLLFLNVFILLVASCSNNANNLNKRINNKILINHKIENYDFSTRFNDISLEKKVKILINNIVKPSQAQKACEGLEKLGHKATPYIIMQMDNFKQLPYNTISFKNKNAFEAVRHIKVKKVVDVLSEVLSQIEGKVFINISNERKTDLDRKRDIYLWKLWLYKKIEK